MTPASDQHRFVPWAGFVFIVVPTLPRGKGKVLLKIYQTPFEIQSEEDQHKGAAAISNGVRPKRYHVGAGHAPPLPGMTVFGIGISRSDPSQQLQRSLVRD